ncbi:MAG: carboxy terminal-processing peptidase [Saprospiraceae bacterium]
MKALVSAILVVLTIASCQQPVTIRQVHTTDTALLIPKIVQAVEEYHFNPRLIDDVLSKDMFTLYIENLDPKKEFFTQTDINQLSKYELTLDEAITTNNFEFFNTAVSLLENGIKKAEKYSAQHLTEAHDFTIQETLETNNSFLTYAANDKDLKDRWRRKVKKYLLDQMLLEENVNPTSTTETLQEKSREKVSSLLAERFKKLEKISDYSRAEAYANSILKVHDYQSQYLSPQEKSKWDANFNRSFVGVGARLALENGYPKVIELTIGGPIWKAKSLKVNDVILKVKEEGATEVDLFGKSVEEVVSLLKGLRNSMVTLTVKDKSDLIKEVNVKRDKIEFDQAMSFLLQGQSSDQTIGYIRLPRFYAGDPGSAAHVLSEIETLKANNVDGIIFDVRDNMGGSAGECRNLIGYFLNDGVYMQTKRSQGNVNQYGDEDPSVQYTGKLLVLTNNKSGSASELFAGTLQDYKRALIVGGKSTFGKGTMQNFVDLEESDSTGAIQGQVKMSVGLFYTASGKSPQSTGFTPDISLPDERKYVNSGERSIPFSVPADSLQRTEVNQNINVVKDIATLKANSSERVKASPKFQLADQKAKHVLSLQRSNLVPLNIEAYRKQKALTADLEKKWESIYSKIENFQVSFDETPFANDSSSVIKRQRLINQLQADPYLYECYQIISDMIG